MKGIVLVVTLFILAVGVAPTLSSAHCGKKHESEGKIFVAQLSHEELAYELKGLETPPDVAALERAVKTLGQAKNAERLDQLIHDLMLERESKASRTKPSKAD